MKDKKTGLFFGSFNPIHIGHMAIANFMLEFTDLKPNLVCGFLHGIRLKRKAVCWPITTGWKWFL
jgi:nicotinic acid mononucleotide adenylyltransferase